VVAEILPQNNSAFYSQEIVNKEINLFIIVAISIINPIFEELIVVAYIITALSQRKGALFAVNVSVLIRFLYHLYQGPAAALSIIPLGLIFALVYLKWKNIWPLIIAHGIMDFIGLYFYG
jgi:membrane protease YdiL (CAAX protease family)